MNRLPDQLQHHLRLIFVGTAAGQRSADLAHYYAHPGNRFWRTIHKVGIIPRRYQPHEFPSLLERRIGFTDMCKSGAGMDHQALTSPIDRPAFYEKMLQYRPEKVAFTSKKAASLFYGRPTKAIALGRQPAEGDFPTVFVLGLASRRRIGSQVCAAVAGTGGFDETHLRVARKPDERGIIRPFGTSCP